MTIGTEAQKHLTKAKEYLAKGDEFYLHAVSEMELAREAGATWVEIGDALGRNESWCRKIVAWAKTPANERSAQPFGGEQVRASADKYATKKVLSDPDKVQAIVNELPKEAVYEIEKAVAIRLGAPITGEPKVAGNPLAVVRAFDALTPEQQEMAVQKMVKEPEFAEALKQNPKARDEFIVSVIGTPKERTERSDERERGRIEKGVTINSWQEINAGLGEANYGLTRVLGALSKLIINGRFDADEDPLGVSHKRAESVGRTIYEIEAAWGHTPFTDKIMELRSQYADHS